MELTIGEGSVERGMQREQGTAADDWQHGCSSTSPSTTVSRCVGGEIHGTKDRGSSEDLCGTHDHSPPAATPQATFTGYAVDRGKHAAYMVACVLTLGILPLLSYWLPLLWLRLTCSPAAFHEATYVFVKVRSGGDMAHAVFLPHPWPRQTCERASGCRTTTTRSRCAASSPTSRRPPPAPPPRYVRQRARRATLGRHARRARTEPGNRVARATC